MESCKRRNTAQKESILRVLQASREHPTAEAVHNAVVRQMPTVTLATVYRNLNRMVQDRQIQRLESSGRFRYDADISSHQHLICRGCEKIMDLFERKISDDAMRSLGTVKSLAFEAETVAVLFQGTCKGCMKKIQRQDMAKKRLPARIMRPKSKG